LAGCALDVEGREVTLLVLFVVTTVLRAAYAQSEDMQTVQYALLNRRLRAVTLNLPNEEYEELKSGK